MRTLIARSQWYIVILLASLAAVVWYLVWQSSPVSSDTTSVRVNIPNGWTSRDIASALKKADVIRSEFVFRVTARIGGQAANMKPGAYDFNRSMNVFQIIRKLSKGEVAAVWVTVPEGYTIKQIASLLEKNRITSADDFVSIASAQGFNYGNLVPAASSNLEGYLFPDTYLFMPGSNPEQVVKEMLQAFRKKALSPLQRDVEAFSLALSYGPPANAVVKAGSEASWYTILTVASMIEREAKIDKDRPLISAVIWNRLGRGMRLEIDATVLYAMRRHKSRLTYADLKIADPYNTYYVDGLPAGPIANPGLKSIKAAISPAKVDYLYYVAREDGSHIFTRTLEEHNRAKARLRSGR